MKWKLVFLVFLTYLQYAYGQVACTDAQLQGNVLYSYHENDCNQYRQCHSDPSSNENVIVYRSCPWGYYWNQDELRCENKTRFRCPLERCIPGVTTRIESSGCRAYWECSGGAVRPACCAPGQRYVEGQGCVNDYTCMDPCPGPCAERPVCRAFPHWSRFDLYYKMEDDGQSYEKICPAGTNFDILTCGCARTRRRTCTTPYTLMFEDQTELFLARSQWLSTNIQIANGEAIFRSGTTFQANIQAAKPTFTNPLIIMFNYTETFSSGAVRNLLISTDCKKCNVLRVDLVRQSPVFDTFEVTFTRNDRVMAQMILSTEGFLASDRKTAIVIYNGRELLAMVKSGRITYMKRTEAPVLDIMNCGVRFGSSAPFVDTFNGVMSFISIYSCNPADRLIDLTKF